MRWLKNRIKAYIDHAVAIAVAQTPKAPPEQPLPALNILVEKQGYGRTRLEQIPVAADDSPIPWYTYPAIEYFRQLDARGLRIFEFGSGHSSLFWAHKGAEVWSVEHDRTWYERMNAQSACLRQLVLCESPVDYAAAIDGAGGQFDIVIIDGAWRNECASTALSHLRDGGIIIVDNSDWYVDVADYLRKHGFLQIDFSGFGPINNYCWTTSLFVRTASVLNTRLIHPHPIGGIEACKSAGW